MLTIRNPQRISTHSLTKRLTVLTESQDYQCSNFNSQPHEEADLRLPQSASFDRNFNSQPHEEADLCHSAQFISCGISTHSLTKRLTFNSFAVCVTEIISTHSLTKRLTCDRGHRSCDSVISTHSLTKRLT